MIDERLQPWPPDVLDAVARFRQGDVIDLPSLFYLASPRFPLWELSLPSSPSDLEPQLVESEWIEGTRGLITTQTCDISEEGVRAPKKPWIQVAPVFQRLIGGTPPLHVLRLDGPSLAPDSVVDLRIEMPVEKGWLVNQMPSAGFSSADGFRGLAQRLALIRQREAFPDWVVTSICRRLRDDDQLRDAGLLHDVEEIRLAFSGDDLSTTKSAGLIVLVSHEASIASMAAPWSEWCAEVATELDGTADLLPVLVLTPDMMSAREYRMTAPVRAYTPN